MMMVVMSFSPFGPHRCLSESRLLKDASATFPWSVASIISSCLIKLILDPKNLELKISSSLFSVNTRRPSLRPESNVQSS